MAGPDPPKQETAANQPSTSANATTPQPAPAPKPEDGIVGGINEAFKADAKLAETVVAAVRAGSALGVALDKPTSAQINALTAPVYVRYKLALTLSRFAKSDPTLMNFLLRQAIAIDLNLKDVASKYYSIPAEAAPATPEIAKGFQTNLFAQEAAASILGLVDRDEIQVDLKVKAGVISLIRVVVQKGSNFSQMRAASILDSGTVTLNADIRTAIITTFEDIQRLSNIARLPQQIDRLLQKGYTSANSIVQTPVADFVLKVRSASLDIDDARRIHDFATTIEVCNEQAWATRLRQRNDDLVVPKTIAPGPAAQTPQVGPADTSINLATLFKDIDSVECSDCTAVTSPSAYFVDLLRFLQQVRKDTGSATSPTLFSTLMKRRPDLQYLQLSCANTNTTLPYIDLVNEQLEYFVRNINGKTTKTESDFTAYNSQALDGATKSSPHPQNIQADVYQTYLQRQRYPLSQLPYNYANDVARVILSSIGSSREAILRTFRADESRLVSITPLRISEYSSTDRDRIAAQNSIANERAIAAESLGLGSDDYLAITGEGFEPVALVQAYRGGYTEMTYDEYRSFHDSEWTKTLTPAGLWGYLQDGDKTASAQMLDDKLGTGLTFIKSQFLPRSGLTMAELLEILSTQFIARRLAIVADTPDGSFTNDLTVMRLRTTALVDPESDKLTEDICRDLQAFIRLRKKSGLSTAELDAIICGSIRSDPAPTGNIAITASIVDDLAAAKEISSAVRLSLGELQPLWGTIDFNGPKSLYSRLFLSPTLTALDPVFATLAKGEVPAQKSVGEHRTTVIMSLGITDKDLDAIMELAGLKASDPLTTKAISTLYRTQTICTVFGIKSADFSRFLGSSNLTVDMICKSPQSTLQYLKQWREISGSGVTIDELGQIIPAKSSIGPVTAMMDFAVKLGIGMASVERTYPLRRDEASGYEEVQKAVSLLFESAAVPQVLALTEGTFTSSYSTKSTGTKDPSALVKRCPLKVRYESTTSVGQGRLTLAGILTQAELKMLLEEATGEADWKTAIETLNATSTKLLELIRLRLQMNQAEMEKAFLTDPHDDEARRLRRLLILTSSIPVLRTQLARQVVLDVASASFSSLDSAALLTILTDAIKPTGQTSALDTLRILCDIQPDEKTFTGYFIPPTTGIFVFVSKNMAAAAELVLDGQTLKAEILGQERRFKTPRLANGTAYKLVYKGDLLKELRFMPRDGLTPMNLPIELILDERIVQAVRSIWRGLSTAVKLADKLKITPDEIQYFHRAKSLPLTFDFNDMSIRDLQEIVSYAKLRDTLATTSAEPRASLLELFAFCKDPWKSGDTRTWWLLYLKISSVTGWSPTLITAMVKARLANTSISDVLNVFRGIGELKAMHDIMSTFKDLTSVLPSLQITTLFNLAMRKSFTRLNTYGPEFEAAEQLRVTTSSAAAENEALQSGIDTLRQHRRAALLAYLLNHTAVKALGITNEDTLFENLLIDVQMGPQLLTSRTKQAISTVHLFLQRCMLGLEKWDATNKIGTAAMSKTQWSYLSQYSLWEANRKIFLYPENWIDPALRDNKTEHFKAFEAKLQGSNIDKATVVEAIRGYIYDVNEIAQLEYLTYVWEHVENTVNKYHFFARTKNEPYSYYYRMFKHTQVGTKWVSRWDPWMKIDIDIATQDTDFDNATVPGKGVLLVPAIKRGRLYLFLPQIMVKTTTNAPPNPRDMKGMWDKPPERPVQMTVWEIRMAWTELRNGKWTPKQVSKTYLTVRSFSQPKGELFLPRLPSVRFWVETGDSGNDFNANDPRTDDTVVINVEAWYEAASKTVKPTDEEVRKVLEQQAQAGKLFWNVTIPDKVMEERSFGYGWNLTRNVKRWGLGRFRATGAEISVDSSLDLANDISVPSYFTKLEATLPAGDRSGRRGATKFFPGFVDSSVPESAPNQPKGRIPFLLSAPDDFEAAEGKLYKWIASFNIAHTPDPTALLIEGWVGDRVSTTFSCHTVPTDRTTTAEDRKLNVVKQMVLDYPFVQDLMERSTRADDVAPAYDFLSGLNVDDNAFWAFGAFDPKEKPIKGYGEQSSGQSLYLWEMHLHTIMLLMDKLLSSQQFELALEMARYIFDPRRDGKTTARCWKFYPFQDANMATMGEIQSSVASKPGATPSETIAAWRDNPFSPHAVARGRPVAYMKWIVHKYIEILIAAGDEFFNRNSLESIPLAIQRYTEASQLFGPRPRQIPALGSKGTKTFAQLDKTLNQFSNAAVEMELDYPYMCDPRFRGAKNSTTATAKGLKPSPFIGIAKTTYFCVPPNPRVGALRDLIDDRLFKIRNSMDINGNVRSLLLWEPPIDPGMVVQAKASGMSTSLLLADLDAPMPNYRFLYLLQKAFEVCAELKSVGEAFLAAKEKRDAEAFSLLTARQSIVSETMLVEVKMLQRTEVEKSIAVLEETRKSHAMRLSYYLRLSGESLDKVPDASSPWQDVSQEIEKPTMDDLRMSSNEKTEMEKADSAAGLTIKASALEAIAAGLEALPHLTTTISPMGVGMMLKIDSHNIAKFMQGTAVVMRLKAEVDSHESEKAGRKANLIRQLQERRLQANLAGYDIKQTDKELEMSKVRLALCNKDIEMQRNQVDNAKAIQDFYQGKYTNERLYAWMEGSIRTAYYNTYLAAMQIARKAEKSFLFEHPAHRGRQSYLAQSGFWDSGRDGLLSAHNLYLSLKRLEATYHEKRAHDFEITKNISIRQVSPSALVSLRELGKAEFSLPEVLFDMDFPGQYMRRIKTVNISMPCIVGPYTGMNCILTLVEHRTRTSSKKGDKYEDQGRDDDRFRSDRVPMSSIAMSSGQSDTGLFELDTHDERYLPFEGTGVLGRWKIEFPSEIRQFDYNTISDIILQVRYTALDGGSTLRQAANTSVREYLKTVSELDLEKGGFSALIDLKNDFPNEWYQFASNGDSFTLANIRDRLPFWTRGAKPVMAKALYFIINSASSVTDSGVEEKGELLKFEEADKVKFELPAEGKLKKASSIPVATKGTGVYEIEGFKATNVDAKYKIKFKVPEPKTREAIGSIFLLFRYSLEYR